MIPHFTATIAATASLLVATTAGIATAANNETYYFQSDDVAAPDTPAEVVDEIVSEDAATTSNSDVPTPATTESLSVMTQPITTPQPYAMAPAMHPANGGNVCGCDKEKKAAALAKMKSAYQGVFYANDFSYLNDPCYDGPTFFGDNLKNLWCNRLDVGGEFRTRYHNEQNHRGLGLTGNDDQFWLNRLRLFANYRINDTFRAYGEYLYADSAGEVIGNRPIEENRGEIQNLFLDTKLFENTTLRLGRQEILLGAQRFVSPLDWANTRRTFDGGRVIHKEGDLTLDGFFLHPVNRNTANESKIDDTNENVDFYGLYATQKNTGVGTMEAYFLGLNNSVANFEYYTLGSRIFGKTDGGTLYEFEGAYQFGDNSPGFGSHSAGFVTAGLGRKISINEKINPTIWLWYDWASGGDDVPAARGDNGFDHGFPLAHKYNGFMDLFGRRNLNDVNVQFILPINQRVKLLVWYHYFFLDQKTTPYSVVLTPYNAGNAAVDRELGHEIDVLFNIAVNPRNNVLLGYSPFSAGDYFDNTPGVASTEDADFFYMQYQMRF
ncbi:MAG: alginate export family protein [Planctomycetota bacterium]